MGWDTTVILLAEQLATQEEAIEVAQVFFEKEGQWQEQLQCFWMERDGHFHLFYSYERRKYLPYWVVQEIAPPWPKAHFTLLGSSPDFLAGPAGLIRIQAGNILDSYGIWAGHDSGSRELMLEAPLQYAPIIMDWYGANGPEAQLRSQFEATHPKGWCEENYAENIIPIPENDHLDHQLNAPPPLPTSWTPIALT